MRREFLESLEGRQKLSLAHITPKDILKYRTAELAAGKSPKTANTSVKIVSTAFNAAFRQSYIPHNPCKALEHLPEETAERDTFTAKQVSALIKTATGDWKGAIMFAYYTGARLGDIANMTWSAIDLNAKTITFLAEKTKKKKKQTIVPLHPDLERQLLKSPGIGKAHLFPSLAGKNTGGKTGLSGQFTAIMEDAEITGKITRHTPEGRANNSLSFHSFRHTFTSALANAGVSPEIRQKLSGHATAKTNAIYTHHELAPLRAAIATLPRL